MTGLFAACVPVGKGSGLNFVPPPPLLPMVVTSQPGGGTSQTAWSQQPNLQLLEASGSPSQASGVLVTAEIVSGPTGAVLGGTLSATSVSGVVQFSNLMIDKAGTYTLTFQAPGYSPISSASFNVTFGSAANLIFAQQPLNTMTGSGFPSALQVYIADAAGNLVTSANNSISLSIDPPSSTLTLVGSVTQPAVNGTATFGNLTLTGSATGARLRASASGFPSVQSNSFNVLGLIQPSSSTSTLTTSANTLPSGTSVTVTATMRDASGQLLPGLAGVTFAMTTGSGVSTGVLSPVTDHGDGTYTVTFTGNVSGTATMISSYSRGVAIGGSVSETVLPGLATQVIFNGQSSVNMQSCSTAFFLTFKDNSGNMTSLVTPTQFTFGGAGLGSFYSDAACLTPITSLTPSPGLTSQSFFFKSNLPGAYTFQLNATGFTQSPGPFSFQVIPISFWLGTTGIFDSASTLTNSFYSASTLAGFGGFNSPQGITNDGTYFYATDSSNHVVSKINMATGALVGVFGRISGNTSGIPTGTNGTPGGACTLLSVNSATNRWCVGGEYSSGNSDGMLNQPIGIVYSNGSLYVADYGNHRIVKIDAATGSFQGWIGLIGGTSGMSSTSCPGFSLGSTTTNWCQGGSATALNFSTGTGTYPTASANGGNAFYLPLNLTVDSVAAPNFLFVTDSTNRILKLNISTGLMVGWMGNAQSTAGISCASGSAQTVGAMTDSWCTYGQTTSTGINATIGTVNRYVGGSRGLGYYKDAGSNSWLIMSDNTNQRVVRFYDSGPALTSGFGSGAFAGWTGYIGSSSPASSPSAPTWLAPFIATGCATVGTYTLTPGWCYGGNSQANGSPSGGFYNPRGLTINPINGEIYVGSVSSNTVIRINKAGINTGWIGRINSSPSGGTQGCVSTSPGNPTPGWCSGGGSLAGISLGSFSNPIDLTTDGTNLWIADSSNFRITRHLVANGSALVAAGLRPNLFQDGWSPVYSGYPVNSSGPLTSQYFNRDTLLSGADGIYGQGTSFYVIDRNSHRVKKYDLASGLFQGWIGSMGYFVPVGGDTSCIGALLGGMTPGWCKGGGSNATNNEGFNSPSDLYTNGRLLFISDTSNHRIAMIDAVTSLFKGWIGVVGTTPGDSLFNYASCIASAPGTVTPTWCLGGSSTSSNQTGGFNSPSGLSGFVDVDGVEYVIVADTGNSRLQKINAATGVSVGWVGVIGGSPTGGRAGCSGLAPGNMTPGWCTGGYAVNSNTTLPATNQNNGTMNPYHLMIDTSATPYVIYVADLNSRILKFNATTGAFLGWLGRVSSTTNINCSGAITGNATPGWCTGGTVQAGSGDGQFNGAIAVWASATNLFVNDYFNGRIMKFDKSTGSFIGWKGTINSSPTSGDAGCAGAAIGSITPGWCKGGTAKYGSGINTYSAGFKAPRGLWGNGSFLYVTDSSNGAVLMVPQ